MSYTPTVWQTGDLITAEKLNKIEEGIANAGGGESDFSTVNLTVTVTTDTSEEGASFYESFSLPNDLNPDPSSDTFVEAYNFIFGNGTTKQMKFIAIEGSATIVFGNGIVTIVNHSQNVVEGAGGIQLNGDGEITISIAGIQ